MARLNDPPAPAAESLDALKRRFIRQNREIARVNSTQSQRIRNLETEISRLLAENISLREQAIAAATEAEQWRTSNRLGRDVVDLKSRLANKLYEVTALVEELGGLPDKAARRGGTRQRKSRIAQENSQSSDEKDWRNKQTVNIASVGEEEGHEGRLPAILEDKYYPRRTLETEELHQITAMMNDENEDSESPDLGPPPTAHLEVSDPIAFDSAKSPKRVSGGLVTADEETWALPRNLETRRKRRTSSLVHEMTVLQDEVEQDKQDVSAKSTAQSRAVAKRKFEASEMELEENTSDRNDGFEYQRRDSSALTRPKPSRFAARPASRDQHTSTAKMSNSPQKPSESRKVLAAKSTNSPTKKAMTIATEKTAVVKEEIGRSTSVPNRRRTVQRPVHITTMDPSPADEIDPSDRDVQHPPKTPAASLEDMISPPSSVVDTLSKKSIEAAITNSVEDVLNGSIGRGSRRAKAAISYAEPNLRDKMRRPDKKLVGAVEGLNKPANTTDRDFTRETMGEQSLEPGQSISSIKVITIKPETTLDAESKVRWKDLPEAGTNDDAGSPLKGREKSAAARIYEARKKRTYSESEGTKRTPTKAPNPIDKELNNAVSRLSIFDPPNSSPVSSKTIEGEAWKDENNKHLDHSTSDMNSTTERPTSAASNIRTRRHSVQASANSRPVAQVTATEKPSLTRANSVISMRDVGGKENVSLPTSKLKRASSVHNIDAAKPIGSRRRSMMRLYNYNFKLELLKSKYSVIGEMVTQSALSR